MNAREVMSVPTATSLNPLVKSAKSALESGCDPGAGLRILRKIRDRILDPAATEPSDTFYASLLDGLTESDFHIGVNAKSRTIAYGIWHSTRIEDMAMNVLILGRAQWFDRSGTGPGIAKGFRSTGNELDGPGILELSRKMDIAALLRYQREVWCQTNEALARLSASDLVRKVDPAGLEALLADGSVGGHPDAVWLLEFWGKKNVAGLLMMPMCRHQIVHWNEGMEAKARGMRATAGRSSPGSRKRKVQEVSRT